MNESMNDKRLEDLRRLYKGSLDVMSLLDYIEYLHRYIEIRAEMMKERLGHDK